MYNLGTDAKHPEASFQFNPYLAGEESEFSRSHRPKSGFGLEPTEEICARSFTFGANDGFGKMTAYCLMDNGDVYSLCPVLPTHSSFSRQSFKALHQSALAEAQEAQSAQSSSAKMDKLTFLDKLMATSTSTSVRSSMLHLNYSYRTQPKPMPAGPYRTEPAPIEVTELEESCDITVAFDRGIEVFAISYQSGRIDLCVSFENEPFWGPLRSDRNQNDEWTGSADSYSDGDSSALDPWFLVVESVQLGTDLGDVQLFLQSQNEAYFICYHDLGAHQLDCSSWIRELRLLLEAESSKDVSASFINLLGDQKTNEGFWTDVSGIIDTSSFRGR